MLKRSGSLYIYKVTILFGPTAVLGSLFGLAGAGVGQKFKYFLLRSCLVGRKSKCMINAKENLRRKKDTFFRQNSSIFFCTLVDKKFERGEKKYQVLSIYSFSHQFQPRFEFLPVCSISSLFWGPVKNLLLSVTSNAKTLFLCLHICIDLTNLVKVGISSWFIIKDAIFILCKHLMI